MARADERRLDDKEKRGPMDETAYFGWMRVIAAAHTAAELAVLERRLQTLPADTERDQLADLCAVRRVGLVGVAGASAGLQRDA